MKHLALATALTAGLLSTAAHAQDMTKEQVENIVKEYIQNNPEIILDSVEAYGMQQQVAEREAQQEAVEEHLDWLENNEMLPVAGNPDGDVTIVEFFDYNCGYCKKAVEDVTTLMAEDDNVKFVLVDMPILGRTSELAAKWSYAAKQQDAYLEYHIALMQNRGMITEDSLESIAENIGLDVAQMRQDAESDAADDAIRQKSMKAAQIGISGTPAFIVNGKLYGGYIGIDTMRKAVEEARNNKEG